MKVCVLTSEPSGTNRFLNQQTGSAALYVRHTPCYAGHQALQHQNRHIDSALGFHPRRDPGHQGITAISSRG